MSTVMIFKKDGQERRIDVSGVLYTEQHAHARNILNAHLAGEGEPIDGWVLIGTLVGEAPAREQATDKRAKETR